MAPTLAAKIFAARAQAQVVDRLMGDLAKAHASGNVARIANAAHDASMAAIELDSRLGAVFSLAAEIDSAEWDREYERRFGKSAA